VAGAGGLPEVAGAGGVPEVAGAGGAVVAGAGGGAEVAGAGGAVRAGAGGAVVAGAGGTESPGAGGADSPGAGGADSPGAGAVAAAGAIRDGATVLLGRTTGALTVAGPGAGVGIVTISPGVGWVGEAGVASAVCVGLAAEPGKPCRCPDVSVTLGAGGERSVGSDGPGAVDWPSCGPSTVGSAAWWAHAPALPAITAATSAARRAMGVMGWGRASRMPAPGRAGRHDEGVRTVPVPWCHARVARSSRAHRLAAGTPIAMRVDMPARSIDTATLTFGLVAIPVRIYATSERSHEIHFHLVHEGCGERLHQQYVCPRHGAVDRDEIIKGYELSRGNFVELSRPELEALEAVASDEIAIQEFVPAAAVDPLLVEHTYYLGPGKGGERAYRLLRDALATADLVGIASYAARGKQYIVELLPYQTGLAMLQLRYADELKPWSEIPAPAHVKPSSAELALASKIIDNLRRATFDPSRYHDEVKDRVRDLIASKAKGGEIVAPPSAERPPVTDLMAALKASLGAPGAGGDGAPPTRRAAHGARSRRSSSAGRARPAQRARTAHRPRATRASAQR
jgi:DNA end-binding protein Ku